MNPWGILNIDSNSNIAVIRDAYLKQLGSRHPAKDPDMFQRLRNAYEFALNKISRKGSPAADENFFSNNIDFNAKPPSEKKLLSYINNLLDRLYFENEKSALFYLDEIVKENDFNQIYFKAGFEQALQFTLATLVPFPLALANRAIELFQWNKNTAEIQTSYLAAINILISRTHSQEKQQELESLSKHLWNRKARLAKALLGPYKPWKFRWLALSTKNLSVIKEWFTDFDKNCPDLLRYSLNKKTVLWWRNAIKKKRTPGSISELCSKKIQAQITYMPIFVMAFTLSLLFPDALFGVFTLVAYGLLLAFFGPSLFFIINFVALVLSFIISTQPWFIQIGIESKLKLHTLCVMDITVSYFILNLLMILLGGTVRVVLGIRKDYKIDKMFYGFLLITFILLAHIVGFGVPNPVR